jgi:hypothetical protein
MYGPLMKKQRVSRPHFQRHCIAQGVDDILRNPVLVTAGVHAMLEQAVMVRSRSQPARPWIPG